MTSAFVEFARAANSVASLPRLQPNSGSPEFGRSNNRRNSETSDFRWRGGEGANCPAPSANSWASACEDLTSALRNWPVREIERGVRLTEPQRVAFYELVTSSLRAATAAIRPALTRFYEALDQGQKVRFAGMS